MRFERDESAREHDNVVNGSIRGLRVANFGKKNIFVLTGMFAGSRASDVAVLANHRRSIRKTRARRERSLRDKNGRCETAK